MYVGIQYLNWHTIFFYLFLTFKSILTKYKCGPFHGYYAQTMGKISFQNFSSGFQWRMGMFPFTCSKHQNSKTDLKMGGFSFFLTENIILKTDRIKRHPLPSQFFKNEIEDGRNAI